MNRKTKVIFIMLLAIIFISSFQGNANEEFIKIKDDVKYDLNNVEKDEAKYDFKEVEKANKEFLKNAKERSVKLSIENSNELNEGKEKKYITLTEFVEDASGLSEEDSQYLIEASENIEVDPLLMLSLIRVESYFDPYLVGSSGERGLGQLMANTAKPVANRLGVEYIPDKLFEPKYNIMLFTAQFEFLLDFYEGDIHKTLTAYNRGQYGLEKYMASRSSSVRPEVSIYSSTILKYAEEYKNQFDNSK